jgi:outer membrane protein
MTQGAEKSTRRLAHLFLTTQEVVQVNQSKVWLFICFLILISSSAHAAGLEVAVGGWYQDPSGDLSYKSNDVLDVSNDLKYGTETRLHGRAKIKLPAFLPNIYLMAAPSEFDGTGQKNVSFRFGDEVFQGNEPFYSKLTFNQYDVAFYYGLPFISVATLNKLNFDIGVNVRIIDLDARIRQDTAGFSQRESVTVAIPQLFIGVRLAPLDWLAVEAEGRGLTINGNSVYSLVGRVQFDVVGPVLSPAATATIESMWTNMTSISISQFRARSWKSG